MLLHNQNCFEEILRHDAENPEEVSAKKKVPGKSNVIYR